MIHSLAMVLFKACSFQEPRNQREACVSLRKYLIGAPGLHPLTLERRRERIRVSRTWPPWGGHCSASTRRVCFASTDEAQHRGKGACAIRHSTARSPPDELALLSSVDVPPIVIHLWNWPCAGTSGAHYDGLVAELPPRA